MEGVQSARVREVGNPSLQTASPYISLHLPTNHLEENILQVLHILDFEHMLLVVLFGSQGIDVRGVHQRPDPKHIHV